ncbi:MAG TPA: hypothetical protein ENK18_26520 [Deltaproteobacteria bacterium]|nr:hypothetical protein [Deltaproteobacteria bacterium]
MTQHPEDSIKALDRGLSLVYRARPWLIALDVLQGASAVVERLAAWGAPPPFVIAARVGTGPAPACEHRVLGLPPMPMMEAIHAGEEALRSLPADVRSAIEAFDPDKRAAVLGGIVSDGRPVAQRPFFGARPLSWRRLEDKVVIDALWDAVGLERAPSEVVEVELTALSEAAQRLDLGQGTVWAGDASQGFHGGASYTVAVRTPTEGRAAVARLAPRCRTARVMPFLEGVPCSIHGIVFPEHVVVLRPAELLVFQGSGGFVYGRAATFWDPPQQDRDAMRSAARRVGDHLRGAVGYRGAFTLDGICTPSEGFLPTELNPRVGAALGLMCPEVPFDLLHAALIEGCALDLDPVALEAALLQRADAARHGSVGFLIDVSLQVTEHHPLVWRGAPGAGAWERVSGGDEADATATIGPGPSGGYCRLSLDPVRTPVGPRVAPRAIAFARWLDRRYDAGLGELR